MLVYNKNVWFFWSFTLAATRYRAAPRCRIFDPVQVNHGLRDGSEEHGYLCVVMCVYYLKLAKFTTSLLSFLFSYAALNHPSYRVLTPVVTWNTLMRLPLSCARLLADGAR